MWPSSCLASKDPNKEKDKQARVPASKGPTKHVALRATGAGCWARNLVAESAGRLPRRTWRTAASARWPACRRTAGCGFVCACVCVCVCVEWSGAEWRGWEKDLIIAPITLKQLDHGRGTSTTRCSSQWHFVSSRSARMAMQNVRLEFCLVGGAGQALSRENCQC